MTTLQRQQVSFDDDGDGHYDQFARPSAHGEFYYADEVDPVIAALRAEIEALQKDRAEMARLLLQAHALRDENERLRALIKRARPYVQAYAAITRTDEVSLDASETAEAMRLSGPTTESRQDCVQCEGYGKVIGCLTDTKYDCENCNGTGSVVVRLSVPQPESR